LPLLCLHGGPGATHDYLEPLEEIAATGRCVVFYDQLGSGNPDHPHDRYMWKVALFEERERYKKILTEFLDSVEWQMGRHAIP